MLGFSKIHNVDVKLFLTRFRYTQIPADEILKTFNWISDINNYRLGITVMTDNSVASFFFIFKTYLSYWSSRLIADDSLSDNSKNFVL